MKKNFFKTLLLIVCISFSAQAFAAHPPVFPSVAGKAPSTTTALGKKALFNQALDYQALQAEALSMYDNATFQPECFGLLLDIGLELIAAIQNWPTEETTPACTTLQLLSILANMQINFLEYQRCAVEYSDIPDEEAVLEEIDTYISILGSLNIGISFLRGSFDCL